MPFVPGSLTVSRVDAYGWALVDPLVYQGRWQRFVVPAGFRTDFATVPRVVTWLIPRFGVYTLAAILHDWLCTEGIASGAVTSRDADGIFRRVMRESGVPVLRRWLMWAGVRWGALASERRRQDWAASAPGVLAISLLAAPWSSRRRSSSCRGCWSMRWPSGWRRSWPRRVRRTWSSGSRRADDGLRAGRFRTKLSSHDRFLRAAVPCRSRRQPAPSEEP